ncbi:SDR family NAD(P)-dependent oxidoreductase [Sinimarinibacterium flocculans]|uniref:SDR family NAD(P)-dependent oxidoreductase n=1 Tax=Sinimarinibacterium flocculans TaxID=985250 RepID=UPI0024921549|nr:SDR family NAD(P)-dependent oxidoreductase [Sinimarinibacterium flocculans]
MSMASLTGIDGGLLRRSGVIVTGGSSGLGRETAILLASAGRPVAVWGTDAAKARGVAAECAVLGVTAIGLGVDVGDRDAVAESVAASRAAIGPIGGLACSAGIIRVGPAGAIDFADWEAMVRVNLNGVAYAMEATLPELRSVGRGASIVVVASTEAIRGSPILAGYTASKHGVLGLVRSAAGALGREGIRVNALCAGAMDTPMMRKALAQAGDEARQQMIAAIPLGYISHPKEVAQVIRFLLSPEASYINGAAIPVDGGLTA